MIQLNFFNLSQGLVISFDLVQALVGGKLNQPDTIQDFLINLGQVVGHAGIELLHVVNRML